MQASSAPHKGMVEKEEQEDEEEDEDDEENEEGRTEQGEEKEWGIIVSSFLNSSSVLPTIFQRSCHHHHHHHHQLQLQHQNYQNYHHHHHPHFQQQQQQQQQQQGKEEQQQRQERLEHQHKRPPCQEGWREGGREGAREGREISIEATPWGQWLSEQQQGGRKGGEACEAPAPAPFTTPVPCLDEEMIRGVFDD